MSAEERPVAPAEVPLVHTTYDSDMPPTVIVETSEFLTGSYT